MMIDIKKIDELFDVMGLQEILAEFKTTLPKNASLKERFLESYLSTTVKERVLKEVKVLFGTLLTEEEIDDLIVFYKSNAGQAIIKKLPIINREAAYLGKRITQEMMSDEKLDEEFEMWKRIVEEESREKILH